MAVSVQLMSGEIEYFDLCSLAWGGEPLINDLAREVADSISYNNIGINIPGLSSRVGLYYVNSDNGEYTEFDKRQALVEGAHYYAFIKDDPKYQDIFLLFEDGVVVLKSETGQLLDKYGFNEQGFLFQSDRKLVLTAKLPLEAYTEMRRNLIDKAEIISDEAEIENIRNVYKDSYIFWRFYEEFIRLKTEDIKIL